MTQQKTSVFEAFLQGCQQKLWTDMDNLDIDPSREKLAPPPAPAAQLVGREEVALINYTARWVASSLREHGRNIDLGSLLLQSEDPDTRAKFSFVDVYSSTLTSIYYRNRLKFEEQIHRHRDAAPPSHKN